MGIDLVPRRKGAESLHYNWSGWRAIGEMVDVDLAGSNDGERLSAADCRSVADTIEANAERYNELFGGTPEPMGYGDAPAAKHAKIWRESGGFRQF